MALITDESIERVRQAADIVEVVSAHTDLRRQGAQMMGLCPFHEERSPSFSVDPARKVYHCFGCGVGGDVIRFVRRRTGWTFLEAVELLAERYGVELEREQEDPRAEERRKRRARMGELLERTSTYYAAYLWDSDEARKAREYLLGRGLSEEVLTEFEVGYAPSAWDSVLKRGQMAGFSVDDLRSRGPGAAGAAGWAAMTASGSGSRSRFAIRAGRWRASGRGRCAPSRGRSTSTRRRRTCFARAEHLYGIDRARAAIAKAGRAVVVEGYTDVHRAARGGGDGDGRGDGDGDHRGAGDDAVGDGR